MAKEAEREEAKGKSPSNWINLAVDYGPIIVFFAVYKFYSPDDTDDAIAEVLAVIRSTGAFVVAALVALAVSKWKLGRISPMLWFSTLLIVFFGSITIWTGDERVIQAKPTVVYLIFGVLLIGGWLKGKALLKYLLEAAFEGLTDVGWLKLSRNWGLLFLFFAGLNEVLVWYLSFGDWISAKLWVFLPLTLLFTMAQVPMLLRNGMGDDGEEEALTHLPHE